MLSTHSLKTSQQASLSLPLSCLQKYQQVLIEAPRKNDPRRFFYGWNRKRASEGIFSKREMKTDFDKRCRIEINCQKNNLE